MNIAILGYGNIGRAAEQAILSAPDMTLTGIYHHNDDLSHINADVVLVTVSTRAVPAHIAPLLERGICTVDSFDIHTEIADLRDRMMPLAVNHHATAVLSAGWDPGSDSMIRALMCAMAPEGEGYTTFGPGRSMGHTVAVKAIPGVRDALSMTLPAGKGKHNRHVYVELEDGASFPSVREAILHDPYFVNDPTEVEQVPSVEAINTTQHGVDLERIGSCSGVTNQHFQYQMRICNPALTAQFMVACARAAVRMRERGYYGAFTTIELAPIDLLPGSREEIVHHLV